MRRLAQLCCTLSACALMLWGCDDPSSQSLVDVDGSLAAAAAGTELAEPSGVTVSLATEHRLDVRWTDNSGNETGFEIYRSMPNAGGDYALLATTGKNVVAFNDASVQPGAAYCYSVRAVRVTGSRVAVAAALPVCASTVAPPSNVTAVASSSERVVIAWQDNSGVETGYAVSRSSSGEAGPFYGLTGTGANGVSMTDDFLTPLTRYCYRVQAIAAMATSPLSTVVCVTTPAASAPPPSAYVVSARLPGSSYVEITVAWTNTTVSAPAFRMYRSTDGGAQWQAVTLAGYDNRYTDAIHAIEQPVCYRVVAYNAAGDAAPSNAACVTAPAAPTNFAATRLDATTVRFTWSDNSAVEDGYEVWAYFSRGDCCPGWDSGGGDGCASGWYEGDVRIAELPAGATEYRHTTVTACGIVDYPFVEYWVVAKQGTALSSRSNSVFTPFQSP
jgi:hypothetical protein